jgi:hypothetical protein
LLLRCKDASGEDRAKILADLACNPARRKHVARWRVFGDPEDSSTACSGPLIGKTAALRSAQ